MNYFEIPAKYEVIANLVLQHCCGCGIRTISSARIQSGPEGITYMWTKSASHTKVVVKSLV